MWPGDFSTQRRAGRDAATAGAAGTGGASRYAGAMSASWSSQRAYDGTRYCVGKIMLRKSHAGDAHALLRRAARPSGASPGSRG